MPAVQLKTISACAAASAKLPSDALPPLSLTQVLALSPPAVRDPIRTSWPSFVSLVANANALATKRDAFVRYIRALSRAIDWAYSGQAPIDALAAADEALFDAKRTGRNRVAADPGSRAA